MRVMDVPVSGDGVVVGKGGAFEGKREGVAALQFADAFRGAGVEDVACVQGEAAA